MTNTHKRKTKIMQVWEYIVANHSDTIIMQSYFEYDPKTEPIMLYQTKT